MNNHVTEFISAYMDGELSEEEARHVEAHLQECQSCQEQLDDLLSIKAQMAAAYQSIDLPDGIAESVMTVIHQEEKERTRHHSLTKWAVFIPVVLAALFLLIQLTPGFYFGMSFASTLFNISLSIFHAVTVIISSLPYVLSMVVVIAGLIIAISIWSLRRLLETRTIFDD
ncbi:putative zinc finger protein [Scopulibacillus darangshiensis]|uniref:Anti-sigma-W factor RsiW n=1 Tax=Scopulibacillus darangshiensis TaxID=442528 RepID=A0A4R2P4T8_9BACL|nr:zf-HC2 domain-containing protein [Scopulibacillus darangshiensis]TCP28961.1 putative zinc finger protein [Scopulibacillus darangshiensis]